MEANKDEAIRCREIAEVALASGDAEKCIRLLKKSLRLFDDPKTHSLLQSVYHETSPSRRASTHSHRPHRQPHTRSDAPRPGSGEYTPEQVKDVQKILSTKSHYDILDVGREATDVQIKKAYRRLALKFHPDKCKAPSAEDAFKRISKAFQCLSDSAKRRQYDVTGRDSADSSTATNCYEYTDTDFITPDDIFSAFFGGGQATDRHPNHNRGGRHHHGAHESFKFLPILIFFAVSVIASLFTTQTDSAPRFSFSPTRNFKYRSSTATFEVPFYVPEDYMGTHPTGSVLRSKFEERVEAMFISNIFSECQYEERLVRQRLQQARWSGAEADVERIQATTRPNCEKLNTLKAKAPKEFQRRVNTLTDIR
jgi:hypothetical protein